MLTSSDSTQELEILIAALANSKQKSVLSGNRSEKIIMKKMKHWDSTSKLVRVFNRGELLHFGII